MSVNDMQVLTVAEDPIAGTLGWPVSAFSFVYC